MRELVLAGRVIWHAPHWLWLDLNPIAGISHQDMSRYRPLIEAGVWARHPLYDYPWHLETRTGAQIEWDSFEAQAQAAGWEPAFPGAARTLYLCFLFGPNDGCEATDPAWVAHLGLDLPPTVLPNDRHPYSGFDNWLERYNDDQIGFHPPLRPGVNVTFAVEADLNDLSLRPECPEFVKVETLEQDWHYPRGFAGVLDDRSYEGYLKRTRRHASNLGGRVVEVDSGWGAIWSETHGTWFWRETVNTPYGWYTFDIDTMQRRLVDTSPGSWDFANLWQPQDGVVGAVDSLGVAFRPWRFMRSAFGGASADNPGWYNFVRERAWPAFDPWGEVLLPGQAQTRPGLFSAYDYDSWSTGYGGEPAITGYLRLTCTGE